MPFFVPWRLDTPEIALTYVDLTYSRPDAPPPGEITVRFDGEPVELGPYPDFPGSFVGTIADETHVNGLHELEISYQGLTNRFPVYVGFGVDEVAAAPEADVDPDEPGQGEDQPGTDEDVLDDGDESQVVDEEDDTDEADGEPEEVDPLGERDPFRWLVAPRDFDPTPPHLVEALLIALLLILLIGFQGDLVNKTIEENRHRMWVGPRRLAAAVGSRWSGSPLTRRVMAWSQRIPDLARAAILLLAFSALSATMLVVAEAPTDWWGELAQRMPPIALGTALVAAVYSGVAELYERRITPGSTARFRVIVWALVPAALMALVSAAGDFQPPYIYALIAGYLLDDDPAAPSRPELGTRASAVPILAGAGALVALAGLSYVWLANLTGTGDGAGSLLLQTVFVGSVQALVFGLMPFTFLDGSRVKAWSTPAWLGVYATGALGFVYVLVLQRDATTEAAADGDLRPFAVTAALFVVFAAASFLFWGYYRLSYPPGDLAGEVGEAGSDGGEGVAGVDEEAAGAGSVPDSEAAADDESDAGEHTTHSGQQESADEHEIPVEGDLSPVEVVPSSETGGDIPEDGDVVETDEGSSVPEGDGGGSPAGDGAGAVAEQRTSAANGDDLVVVDLTGKTVGDEDGDGGGGGAATDPTGMAVDDDDGDGFAVDLTEPTDVTDPDSAGEAAKPVVEAVEGELATAPGDPGSAGDPPMEGDDGAPRAE